MPRAANPTGYNKIVDGAYIAHAAIAKGTYGFLANLLRVATMSLTCPFHPLL